MSVVACRLRLLVPLAWEAGGAGNHEAAAVLASSVWVCRADGRERPGERWHAGPSVTPDNLHELAPQARALLGLAERDRGAWSLARVHLGPLAMADLFEVGGAPHVAVQRRRGADVPARPVSFDVVLLPLGDGLAAITLEIDAPGEIDDVCGAVQALRRVRSEADGGRWRCGAADGSAVAHEGPWAALRAVREGRAICLRELIDGLLAGTPGLRVGVTGARSAQHQVAVVLDTEPAPGVLHAALFRLCRGFDARHEAGLPGIDRVLALRDNRVLSLAREGMVAMSWLEGCADPVWERERWPSRLTDLYGELVLLALAESMGLNRLEVEVAGATTRDIDAHATRSSLRGVARRILQYTVAMSADDSGGMSDHVAVFEAGLAVWRIRERRAELRQGVSHLLALADAAWQDEQDERRDVEGARQLAFERVVATAAAFAVPASMCSGLFGMVYRPGQPMFAVIVGVSLLSGMVLSALGWWKIGRG